MKKELWEEWNMAFVIEHVYPNKASNSSTNYKDIIVTWYVYYCALSISSILDYAYKFEKFHEIATSILICPLPSSNKLYITSCEY